MKLETAIEARELLLKIDILDGNRDKYFDIGHQLIRKYPDLKEDKDFRLMYQYILDLIDQNRKKLAREISVLS